LATERYDGALPVNIGAGFEISIKQLVELLTEMTGFQGRIVWDTNKPNGQPRRMLDTEKAKKEFGLKGRGSLESGLLKTIAWFKAHYPA
jgi:GDP-L-fucose synthase